MTTSILQYKAEELYTLVNGCKTQLLFGLPDKKSLLLKGTEQFEAAKASLIEKQLLDAQGHLTKVGFLTIQLLENYAKSESYIRINNMMFSFTKEQQIIAIREDDLGQYQLLVFDQAAFLIRLHQEQPLFRREPLEGEKTFLKKNLAEEEKQQLEAMEVSDFLNIEYFALEDGKVARDQYEQWLFFEKKSQLYAIDVPNEQPYHVSQYFLVKKIYDMFKLPYKEVPLV